jgi:hypothetical protein
MTHTKGKWFYNRERIYSDCRDYPIAQIYDLFIDDAEAIANAKLICAAPAMLKALELALKDFKGNFEATEENRQATIKTLTTAIKQAKGRA